MVVMAFRAEGDATTVNDACVNNAAARVTFVVYVCVVVPSCAVTTVVMVLLPTLNEIAPLALPLVTAVPLMAMVALAWLRVDVTVMEETLLATDAV